ncbi:MAG: hypothetical protein JST05_08445 [Acidobacteria bacterium]|nr:hypothetical protein [Acidobacteriota bacterium]
MRPLMPALCVLVVLGCAKPNQDGKSTSQFAEISLNYANPKDPNTAYLNCTAGLIPAYKYKDPAELQAWIFPYASGPMLSRDGDLSNPALHGRRVPIMAQSFTGEGALLNFQVQCPGAAPGMIFAVDIYRKNRHLDRIFGLIQ